MGNWSSEAEGERVMASDTKPELNIQIYFLSYDEQNETIQKSSVVIRTHDIRIKTFFAGSLGSPSQSINK